jgi:hypothetical protein
MTPRKNPIWFWKFLRLDAGQMPAERYTQKGIDFKVVKPNSVLAEITMSTGVGELATGD